MSFLSKMKKGLSLGLAVGGGVLTVTGAVLLGVGCNNKVTIIGEGDSKLTFGVGSQNYGKKYGKNANNDEWKKISYGDYKKEVDAVDSAINSAKEIKDAAIKIANGNQLLIDAANKAYDEAVKFPNAVKSGYAMMVSGAVLFSIFVLVMFLGIIGLKKGGKSNKAA